MTMTSKTDFSVEIPSLESPGKRPKAATLHSKKELSVHPTNETVKSEDTHKHVTTLAAAQSAKTHKCVWQEQLAPPKNICWINDRLSTVLSLCLNSHLIKGQYLII